MNGNLFPSSDGRYLVVWHISDDNAVVDSPSSAELGQCHEVVQNDDLGEL